MSKERGGLFLSVDENTPSASAPCSWEDRYKAGLVVTSAAIRLGREDDLPEVLDMLGVRDDDEEA